MRSRLYSLWLAVVAVIAACALGILGLPAAAFAQSPAVTFTPSSGPVGTSFTITGSNWMPGGQVTSTLPYGSPGWFTGYQAPTVDANGKFSYTETVGTGPGGPTPSGTYTYTYVENSLSATQTFTVTGQSSGAAPHITGYTTYTQGVMVILSVTYTGTADGFGFKGINGSGWAEENHPLSSPSYGHVSPGKIEYPFNHACGTSNANQSDVAFWVYTGAARSETTAHLGCSGLTVPNNPFGLKAPPFVCLGGASCNGTPNPGQSSQPAPSGQLDVSKLPQVLQDWFKQGVVTAGVVSEALNNPLHLQQPLESTVLCLSEGLYFVPYVNVVWAAIRLTGTVSAAIYNLGTGQWEEVTWTTANFLTGGMANCARAPYEAEMATSSALIKQLQSQYPPK